VNRETLRRWMRQAGLWRPRSKRALAVHVWRARRSAFGELVMMDSSPYAWLEDRGPAGHLVAMIDDATSRIWGRFVERDTTEENMRTLWGWVARHGRPLALYTDKNGMFVTSRPVQREEQLKDQPARESLFGDSLYSRVGATIRRSATALPGRASTAGPGTTAGGNAQRAGGTSSDR
jgi:hypothetical protein